jgi:hypothetical protein
MSGAMLLPDHRKERHHLLPALRKQVTIAAYRLETPGEIRLLFQPPAKSKGGMQKRVGYLVLTMSVRYIKQTKKEPTTTPKILHSERKPKQKI